MPACRAAVDVELLCPKLVEGADPTPLEKLGGRVDVVVGVVIAFVGVAWLLWGDGDDIRPFVFVTPGVNVVGLVAIGAGLLAHRRARKRLARGTPGLLT